ncbi:hypothetical protein BD310DRAFT_112351 [Dichomitus squalens]|uniref:F-box domain-containing protein n=1 Tax=Dichomitus squalens TaxID=114155 RepID=A0A4Q9PIQ8_9APHY|nr:hypothetical protein BD310DRAFT_112351 [Dichomitus squalens]
MAGKLMARFCRSLRLGNASGTDDASSTDGTIMTLVDRRLSGKTLVDCIVPYPEAFPRPPTREWLPANVPVDFKGPIRTLYAPHDSPAQIHRLPSAVLARVFTAGIFREWREIQSLTHVCRRWRKLVRATPQLWAEAVASLVQSGNETSCARYLQDFLSRTSEAHPIKRIPALLHGQSAIWNCVVPHLSKVSSLSLVASTAEEAMNMLRTIRLAHVRSLASLELVTYDRLQASSFDKLFPWREQEFPCLRELKISGVFFCHANSVASLRSVDLVAWSATDYDYKYLDGLARCAGSLESLSLRAWYKPLETTPRRTHPDPLPLPKVRRLSITGDAKVVEEAFASLALTPIVHVSITLWKKSFVPYTILNILPPYLAGFHAPPFIDTLRIRFDHSRHVTVRCSARNEERLTVNKCVGSLTACRRFTQAFLLPSVTELAINVTSSCEFFTSPAADCAFSPRDHLNLRRFELLGSNRRNLKFRVLDSVLRHQVQYDGLTTERLTLAWGIHLEHGVVAAVDELEKLIEVLTTRIASDGTQLARLEICVTTAMDLDRYRAYYAIRDLCPDRVWSRRVARRFLPKLELLAEDVVILGDWEEYAEDIDEEDEAYCGGGVWREAAVKDASWDWGGGDVVATRYTPDSHLCRDCDCQRFGVRDVDLESESESDTD